MQILIISGQSLVIQSAASLATACYASQCGLRVLLVSMGPTHVLGQMMGQTLGPRPTELHDNLAAMEAISIGEIEQQWEDFRQDPHNSGIPNRIRDIGADELPMYPGIDLVALQLIAQRAEHSGRFDLIIFDGPSTDNLLRGLTLPDSMRWMIRLIFGLDRGPGRSRRSQEVALLPAALLPANITGLASVQNLRMNLDLARSRFLDSRSGTRMRLSLHAEDLAMAPLGQMIGGLGLYGIEVDTLLVRGNKEMVDQKTLNAFESLLLFDTISSTPVSLDEWAQRGKQLYSKRSSGLSLPPQHNADVVADAKKLTLHIPFIHPESLDIAVASEEVVVQFGQFRRHLVLPGLAEGGRLRAKIEGQTLRLWVE